MKRVALACVLLLAASVASADNVLNRTTRQYLASVNTPDFPVEQWIHGPDMTAVAGWPSRYWTITGDVVSLMSQAERDAVDAAALGAQRDGAVAQLDQTEDVLRALVLILLDELNTLRAQATHPITSITRASTTATATTSVPHGLTTGDTITILGADVVAYRKTTAVTVTGASTFTYSVTGSPATPAVGTLYYHEGTPAATPQRTMGQLRAAIRNRLGQ